MRDVTRGPVTGITVGRAHFQDGWWVLSLRGSLTTPVGPELGEQVEALLRRGARRVLLDLARVAGIDAAGMGELTRVYGLAAAVDGVLQVAGARRKVRWLLELAGLYGLLTAACRTDRRPAGSSGGRRRARAGRGSV